MSMQGPGDPSSHPTDPSGERQQPAPPEGAPPPHRQAADPHGVPQPGQPAPPAPDAPHQPGMPPAPGAPYHPGGSYQPGVAQPPVAQPPVVYGQPVGVPYYAVNPYPKNPLGIWSLVLGILGVLGMCLYGFGVLLAIAAVITGHLGRRGVKEGTADNDGMNIAGLITGYATIALAVSGFVVLLVFGLGILGTGLVGSGAYMNG